MAVAVEAEVLSPTAMAVISAYGLIAGPVVVQDEPFVTVFPAVDVAEVVLDNAADIAAAVGYVGELANDVDVVVVVPSASMGIAHQTFRGWSTDVRIQPWWSEHDSIHFGVVEVA